MSNGAAKSDFLAGLALACVAFLAWSFFSILPWLTGPPGRALRKALGG